MRHHRATDRTLKPERTLYKAIEVRKISDGELIHTMWITPPCDSRSIDRRLMGMMRNLREDCYLREVEA